jgi:hypothetical protein
MMATTTTRVAFNLGKRSRFLVAFRFEFGTICVLSMPELGESAEECVVVVQNKPDLHRGRFHLVSAGLTTKMGQFLIQGNLYIIAIE